MTVRRLLCFLILFEIVIICTGSHFRGGTITWRALNTTPSGGAAQILIHQRYAWQRSHFTPVCTSASISSGSVIGSGTGLLLCYSGGGCLNFSSAIFADVNCTDFSINYDVSSGERYDLLTLPLGATATIGFGSSTWMPLAIGGNGSWQLTGRINLVVRPDGKINTSPWTQIHPVIYTIVNTTQIITLPILDYDTTDILLCRWSTSAIMNNTNGFDECGSICSSQPSGCILFNNNCTLMFTLTSTLPYAVALQIEDYFNSTATTPMSSVPVQFLIYGILSPAGCSTKPSIIASRPNQACIGIQLGVLMNQTVVAQSNCPSKMITEFPTSSPMGLTKSSISSSSSNTYTIIVLWIPTASQTGPQIFCASAVDNTNIESDLWCVNFIVGLSAPSLQSPNLNSSFGAPTGTILSNYSYFFLRSGNGLTVNRPRRSGVYIRFNDATMNNTQVLAYDCFSSSNVNYTNDTMTIYTQFSWVPGHHYYITLDSGVFTGNDYCGPESDPITDSTFWTFDIFNLSAVTTTTSTISSSNISNGSLQITTGPTESTTPDDQQTKETISIATGVAVGGVAGVVGAAGIASYCKCCQNKFKNCKIKPKIKIKINIKKRKSTSKNDEQTQKQAFEE